MGTEIEILFPKKGEIDEEKRETEAKKVFEKFSEIEHIFSRFQENSELSRLNKERKMIVSEMFFQMLQYALFWAKKTDGLFNPLVSLAKAGYAKDFWKGEFAEKDIPVSLDFTKILLDNETRFVQLPENAMLDMGGCVKGFAVDEGVKILDAVFSDFLINAGGDLFARGTFHEEKWVVGIENPENRDEDLGVLEIENEAVATSGSYRRKWNIHDETRHHLVSGKTNINPKTDVISVVVRTKTCRDADTFATIAFLLGEKEGNVFLQRNNAEGVFFPKKGE